MSNWHISIQGSGPHHNRHTDDANEIFQEFANELRLSGQHIESATFTYGDAEQAQLPSTTYHITYDSIMEKWSIKEEGQIAPIFAGYYSTQKEAVQYAVDLVGGHGQVIVHKKDGTISDMSQ